MARLVSKTTNKTLVPRLEIAESMWSRMKGLLGREKLERDEALWITSGNSVHTFFMKFPIDLVFVDRKLKVRKTFRAVEPGRLVWPVWGAYSVIEFSSGFLESNPISVGEQLHVDHSVS